MEYILGDGERPFADEDQRRAQVVLGVKAVGTAALLGYGALRIDEALSDRDEALNVVVTQPDGVFATTHDLQADPALALPGIPLPMSRQPIASLKRFSGSLELRYSTERPAALRLVLDELEANQERPIPGIEGGTLSLAEKPGSDGRVQARLNLAAYLAVQDLVFFDAKNTEMPARNRRSEWRDNQGQLSILVKGQPAAVEVRYYPRIARQTVAFNLPGLVLGLVLPGREDLRGRITSGADGF